MRGNQDHKFEDPKKLEERRKLAKQCTEALGLTLPCLVDDMEDTASQSFNAWPERIYVVGTDGKIAFASGPGPWGFKPNDLADHLATSSDE
jgi:type I thyroxine 5'-deiodinase